MAVESIDKKANVSPAPAAASAPAPAQSAPAQSTPPPAKSGDSDRDSREPRRPPVDLCWPPPFHPSLAGIAQIRPYCYHLRRFGGPDAE
ncbi:MAG: hypothetical protein ACAI38_14560 [Myxococcota bacterium]|nr:hypothetical protein [Myxococcota bacterium]